MKLKEIQYIDPNLFSPKDAWDELSLTEKAEMMKVAVSHGITNLQDIRKKYNEFAEGGNLPQTDWSYDSWKKQIAEYKSIDAGSDKTYDYEGFFRKYPQEAWAMLRDDPNAHFSDEFKTVYHPTFSAPSPNNDGSIYSGVKHPLFNPEGLTGGTWSPDYKSFTMSPDGYRSPVSMDERKWYLENAEDNGVQLKETDGSLPIYDGIPWGGVLPAVTVTGNRHSEGGKIHIKPENRGKFTALKERTGHSSTWFKEHGTPAQKKMATFALNARKWKHDDGGPLFECVHLFETGGSKRPPYARPHRKGDAEANAEYNARQAAAKERMLTQQREAAERRAAANTRGAARFNRAANTVMTAMTQQANETPFTGQEYQQAAEAQRQQKVDKAHELMTGAEAALTAGLVTDIAPIIGRGIQNGYRGIRGLFAKTPAEEWTETSQFSLGDGTILTGASEGEVASVERGRKTLLDWVRSPFYRSRLEEEPLYRVADNVVDDAGNLIDQVPVGIKDRSLIENFANGVTSPRPFVERTLPDGTVVRDFNTGLDVSVASDLGSAADDVTLHELLHYMTANSKGTPVSKTGERIINNGWFDPTDLHFDAIKVIHKGRSKGWQNYVMNQNDALLPQYDRVAQMVMERPDEAKAALLKAGRTEEEASNAINSLRDRYSYWYDIQEQRAHLQELFLSKIRPHLKNPNNAAEIEEFLTQNPDILENSSPYKYIQEVRPGSLKQYSQYFASALGTVPFILATGNNE